MNNLILIPIKETWEENQEFITDSDSKDLVSMTMDFYKKVGFNPPWIGYFVSDSEHLTAVAAFKGKPINGQVEIAYGTMERFRKRGIGTQVCRMLVELALRTNASIVVTARTLPEKNYSTRILEENNFILLGTVPDPEDGEVWEWRYIKRR